MGDGGRACRCRRWRCRSRCGWWAEPVDAGVLSGLADVLAKAGVAPRVRMLGFDGQLATGVEARWFSGPRGTLLTLQTAAAEGGPREMVLHLPGPRSVRDVMTGVDLGVSDVVRIRLDGIEPTVLLLAPLG